MSNNEELIWVDKEFAEKYKKLKEDKSKREEQLKVLDEYLLTVKEQSRNEFKINLESLDEDVAIYKGLMISVKQAFEAAKNEHLQGSYAIWEKFDKELPSIEEKTDKVVGRLGPLVRQLNQVNELLGKIQTYDFNRVIESVKAMTGLYGESKDMVEFLVNNFTPKEKS